MLPATNTAFALVVYVVCFLLFLSPGIEEGDESAICGGNSTEPWQSGHYYHYCHVEEICLVSFCLCTCGQGRWWKEKVDFDLSFFSCLLL